MKKLFFLVALLTHFLAKAQINGTSTPIQIGMLPKSSSPLQLILTNNSRIPTYSPLSGLISSESNGLSIGSDGKLKAMTGGSIAQTAASWSEISGKPSVFPSSWLIITDKPATFTPTTHLHSFNEVSGLQNALDSKLNATYVPTWASLTGVPSTFTPTTHGHNITEITGQTLSAAVSGQTLSLSVNDTSTIITLPSGGSGSSTVYDVTTYGANGTDTALDTQAFQNCFNAAPAGATINIPFATNYRVGIVNLTKPVTIVGNKSVIKLVGANAAFTNTADYSGLSISQLTFKGSGVTADNHYAIRPSNSGIQVQNVSINFVRVDSCVVGIDLTSMRNVVCDSIRIRWSKGTSTGQGYGISCGSGSTKRAANITLNRIHIYRSERHGIYIGDADGEKHIHLCTIEEHRFGMTLGGSYWAGMSLARKGGFTVTNCYFKNCGDSPLAIEDDDAVTGQLVGADIYNCTFYGNSYPIVVGSGMAMNSNYGIQNVNFFNTLWQSGSTGHGTAFRVYHGANLNFEGGILDFREMPTQNIAGFDIGGMAGTGTGNITVSGFQYYINSTGSWKGLSELRPDVATGTQSVKFRFNTPKGNPNFVLYNSSGSITNSNVVNLYNN